MLAAGEPRFKVVIDGDRLRVGLWEMDKLPANQGEQTTKRWDLK